MAKHETTFANWNRVFDWAVARGYIFVGCDDGYLYALEGK